MSGYPSQRYTGLPAPTLSHQETEQKQPASNSSSLSVTIGPATLLVRRLPEAIPVDTLSRLFSHYGASSVRPCTGARLRNCAFVDFQDEAMALQAQHQLNGLRFLGKVLSVEKASRSAGLKRVGSEIEKDTPLTPSRKDATRSKDSQEWFKSGHFPGGEPIAEKLGVDYPFPPHLEYAYPPPDGNILTNIVNTLIAVPRFYTQVLHLMNKMNIPAPFRMALPTPPLPAAVPCPPSPPPPPPLAFERSHLENSSDESEMESSDEEVDGTQARKKRIKREAIVGPAIDKGVALEAVGLKPGTLVPREIPIIKKKNPVLQIKIAPKQHQPEDIVNSTMEEEADKPEEVVDHRPYATAEEIESQKLPPEEILSLPMFKNYSAGNPACVLYIKNLAKDVIPDDFYFVFGSLFRSIDKAKSGLSVKLMQEGRMRGQAFVTFPTIELANRALNLANGYVFKGKPMIIQFGRNPATAKPS